MNQLQNQAYKDTVRLAEALCASNQTLSAESYVEFIDEVYKKLLGILENPKTS